MGTDEQHAERQRRVVAVVAMAVTVYYLWWRAAVTLNPQALIFAWSLWGAECFGAVTTFLFYFAVWRPTDRKAPPPLAGKSVDVFIPTKGEPAAVLRKTLLACNDLAYPHRTVVLDDAAREEVRDLCAELRCDYLARPTHEDAKAGNLNYGLKHSTAEFIAIFDADHAPLPHFIEALIGYFGDGKVGFAQSPQEFYNIDSFQHRTDFAKRYVWAEQGLFYYLIEPGRDRWNAAYFVGSCAILRRSALDSIGGFGTGSITEDMLTSIRIHAKGWRSVYHAENLAYGIAAETIHPFHIQRQRWGIGGWQVFWRANPLVIPGLSFAQRLCYLASLIYPFEGFQKLVFYATPPIALFTGILPMNALDISYLLHFVPYYALSIFAFNEMGRGYGGHVMLEQFSMGKFATYLSTIAMLLVPRRSKQFKVTPKGERAAAPHWYIAPQAIVCAASVGGIAFALIGLVLGTRGDEFIVSVNSLWALYNCGLGVAIIRYNLGKLVQRREHFRIPDTVPVRYVPNGDGEAGERLAVCDNLTGSGASLVALGWERGTRAVRLTFVMPSRFVFARGVIVQERTAEARGITIARVGVRFTETAAADRDILSRYLSESAVPKFLGEYSRRYATWLERQSSKPRPEVNRARRALAYIPVTVGAGGAAASHGAIRDISASGCLLSAREPLSPGDSVTVRATVGAEGLRLRGVVARVDAVGSDDFREYLAGVRFDDESGAHAARILAVAEAVEALR